MKTSVILATFNGASHIKEQLESLSRQSDLPDEVIIADDASTDETLEIVNAFNDGHALPIKILKRQGTLGYAKNFSDATMHAENEIILFCDQDDYWEPQKIEIIKKWFAANVDKSLVIHDIKICDENLNVQIDSYLGHLKKNHLTHTFIKGCATAARKELTKRAFPIPPSSKWKHDDRIHAIAKLCGGVGYIEQTLIKHRLHPLQTSGSIINHRSFIGRFLAHLDENSLKASSAAAAAMRMIPGILTRKKARELLGIDGMDVSATSIDTLAAWMRYRHELLINARAQTKILRIRRFISMYLSGGYKCIGRHQQCLADLIRTLKPTQVRK